MNYSSAAAFFVLILFSGCTRVAVREPLGTAIPAEEAIGLIGTWVDPDDKEWVVRFDRETLLYTVSHLDKGELKTDRFSVRDIGDEVYILWFEDMELLVHIPLRVLPPMGEELRALTLLFADESEVESLVEGKLVMGQKNEEKEAWVLEAEGLAPYLSSKGFWRLDTSLLFLRRSDEGEK